MSLMPYFLQTAATSRMFWRERGWPPTRLVPASTRTKGIFSTPTFWMRASRRGMSKLPLKGQSLAGARPSLTMSSSTAPPRRVMWALVVVKWKFMGTTSPGLT